MPLFVVIVNHTLYGSRGPVKVEPICGVFDSIEKAREAIDFLIDKNSDLSNEQFEIDEVEVNETYYEFN